MEGLKIHWKAPLQPKGFIKFIEMFVALLALSLVAGFVAKEKAGCVVNANTTVNLSVTVHYPYSAAQVTLEYPSQEQLPIFPDNQTFEITDKSYMQSAQFFVTWGSFTLFYGVIAVVVYMVTTANEKIEWVVNFLVLTDLIFHIVWVLCWFIASVEWAVAQNELKNYVNSTLTYNLLQDIKCNGSYSFNPGSYAQAAIGDVFGFASIILWLCNIYFVFVDTTFYLQWKSSRLRDYGAIDP